MNQSQHDELSALFSQRMTFQPHVAQPTIVAESLQDEKDTMQTQAEAFISISTHYTHTGHLKPVSEATTSEPSRSPPPPYNEALMPEAMAQLLIQNSVDPSSLLPNQIQLFINAQDEQRLRLLELWRIAPPSSWPREDRVDASWAATSMRQEELLAKVRFETNMASRALAAYQQGWARQDMDFDTHIAPVPISPIREPGEAAWPPAARMRAASIAASRTTPTGHQNISSSDPIYGAAPGLWQSPSCAPSRMQEQMMEDRYGNLMQIRNHADWEAMNERLARERLAGVASSEDPDDMVM